MFRTACAILDGRDSIDSCFNAARVFFASSIVPFQSGALRCRIPSLRRPRTALIVRFNWRARDAAGEQKILGMGSYDC
jgi:hypothetical protein